MPFEAEVIPAQGPAHYQTAHRLVQPLLKPDISEVDAQRRWVDRANDALVYVSSSSSNRDGGLLTFQLVLGAGIVQLDCHFDWLGDTSLCLSRVSLPESLDGSRALLVQLIKDAVRCYEGHPREHAGDAAPTARDKLFLSTKWQVIATPGSALDRQQRGAARRARSKAAWLRWRWRLANALYPLGLLTVLFGARQLDLLGGASFVGLGMASALWLLASLNSDRMRRRLSDWMSGRSKSQSYLNLLGDILVQTQARAILPYEPLRIAIRTLDATLPEYEIRFTNSGWRPVEMIFTESDTVRLLADGFAALGKLEQNRCLGPYNLDEVVPSLGSLRVWCKSAKVVRRRGIPGFHPVTGYVELSLVNMNQDRLLDKFRIRCGAMPTAHSD